MDHDIKDLQKIELEMLDELVRVSEKYHLTYYMNFGTLLGAVRHKGFIPWDDDMDIVYFRNDYETLRKVIKEEIGPDYFVQDCFTDPGHPDGVIRIRKKGTKYIPEAVSHMNLKEYGIWIDVYPIDNVGNTHSIKFFIQAYINKEIITRFVFYRSFVKCKGMVPWKILIHYLSMVFPLKWWISLRDWIYQWDRNDASEFCIIYPQNYSWRATYVPRAAYGEPVKLEFEGKKYNCPNNYELILRTMYGDYMKLPPKEEQVPHSRAIVWEM